MLINLHVKNLALIEEADINLESGLNILTGETGAGKSILIGSINVALGGKVNGDFIRKGAEYGLVELTFKVHSEQKIQALKELDVMELEDGIVLISRKIMPNRSVIKVNGETRTLGEVKEIASLLIDIHGQHEHQSLLHKESYLKFIDRYCGEEANVLLEQLKEKYHAYSVCEKELLDYNMDPEQLHREVAYLEYEINEIEEAKLQAGEDEELEATFRRFHNSRRIMEDIQDAYEALSEGEHNISSLIGRIYKDVSRGMEFDEGLKTVLEQVGDLEDLINGLSADIKNYISDMEYDEEEYARVEERLSFINQLKQKYGNTLENILIYQENQQAKLEKYQRYEENRELAIKNRDEAKTQVLELCQALSDVRRKYAKKLSADIVKALTELNFLDVRFEIQVNQQDDFNEKGFDGIEFIISTNPGEDLRPLSRVASGGELSRIMLAIKTVLADKDDIESLIFDEIDTGISGRTAQMVSVKLNEIAATHQVICITHLPQIASMADEHFMIEKKVIDGSTITDIHLLSHEESVLELARLLGGVTITENVINNAKEMKDLALRTKTSKMI
ncbi:MAG: DNA repair protein RecN [Lachnospiraceae bacterium]